MTFMCEGKTTGRTPIIQHAKKQAYLKALETVGAITVAADAAGIDRGSPLSWRNRDPEFAAAEQGALGAFADRLEKEAVRRAIEGVQKKKFTPKGAPVIDPATGEQYIEREFDSTLLIFMLKGARPDKYKERLDVRVSKEEAEIDDRFTKLVAAVAAGAKTGVAGEEGTGSLRIESAPADGQSATPSTPEAEGLPFADV